MIKTSRIIDIVEKFAPVELAESWDNTGWQINLGKEEIGNVLICLSVTQNILKQAIDNKCDLIISHHPLIFKEFKKIYNDTVTQKLIVDAIKNDIQIYCAHTNLDCAEGGVNDTLCEKLGLMPVDTVSKFVKITELTECMSLDAFILKLKISLNAPKVKVTNPANIQEIKRVAVCSGSGGEFVSELKNVDAFVTGDIKYHTALDVQDIVLIDAGHFETEKIILQTLKNLLHTEAPELVVARENEPWVIA